MNIFNKYFKSNTWIVFILIALIYAVAITIELKYIFTDDFYIKHLSSRKTVDFIQNFIRAERKTEWFNYPLIPVIILVPAAITAFILYAGIVFHNYKVKYSAIFKVAIKADLVFAVNYFIAIILKATGVIKPDISLINDNYYYQSLLVFFNKAKLEFWQIEFLKNINITLIVYILFLSYGMAWLMPAAYKKAVKIVGLWYGVAILCWLTFKIFMSVLQN